MTADRYRRLALPIVVSALAAACLSDAGTVATVRGKSQSIPSNVDRDSAHRRKVWPGPSSAKVLGGR